MTRLRNRLTAAATAAVVAMGTLTLPDLARAQVLTLTHTTNDPGVVAAMGLLHELHAAHRGTGPLARVTQRGRNNAAGVHQTGGSQSSVIHQSGCNHTATSSQTAQNVVSTVIQRGCNTTHHVVQHQPNTASFTLQWGR